MNASDTEVTGHYVTIDGTRTFYDACGTQGPPILCLHPAGTSSMQFYDFIQAISRRGFRAVAIDLPGHGKSYPKDWEPIRSIPEYAAFVRRFLHEVFPGERVIVCGAAIGGAIALELAATHSEDLLAAVAMETTAKPEGEQFTQFCLWWENPHAMPSWRDLSERVAMSGIYGLTGDRLKEFRWQHRYSAQEVSTADLLCWARHDVRDRLGSIACPVLMVKGEADYWVPESGLDAIVAAVPHGLAEKLIVPKMGHYPMIEDPDGLATLLLDFLTRSLSRR